MNNQQSSSFLLDLEERKLIQDVSQPGEDGSPSLAQRLSAGPITGYIGFDPTAASLHVGSLLPVMNLVRLQRAGHRPIAIVGGGTGLIGDPSGKAKERSMLTKEALADNVGGIRRQLERFLDFSGPGGALLVNNADWLCELRLVDFLRDIGKGFTINTMVKRDSVKLRLESREHGISFTEFSYSLLQAFDFLELYDRYGCELQMGGSDQWGNILDGVHLIRRERGAASYGLTSPLVTKSDGSKFGKSEGGNVWLDSSLTTPFAFHQFWLNQSDEDAVRYLGYFTLLPLEEISALEAQTRAHPDHRVAQKRLADEVTRHVHGDAAAVSARRAGEVLFEGGNLRDLSALELQDALAQAPRTRLSDALLETTDAALISVLVLCGLESSRGRARTAIQNGAVSVNGRVERDPGAVLSRTDRLQSGVIVLRLGKKNYHMIEVS